MYKAAALVTLASARDQAALYFCHPSQEWKAVGFRYIESRVS